MPPHAPPLPPLRMTHAPTPSLQGLLGMDNHELAAAFNDLYPSSSGGGGTGSGGGVGGGGQGERGGGEGGGGGGGPVLLADPTAHPPADLNKQGPDPGGMDDLLNFFLKP